SVVSEKQEVIEIEHGPSTHDQAPPTSGPSKPTNTHGDAALAIIGTSDTPIEISPEQDAAVLHKVDKWLIPVMLMVYFLQQLDKSSLSYTSVFGIVSDTHLVGSQYSWLGSIVYVAQLIWQPISSYFIVKLPVGKYLFFNVFMWGVIVACTAAAHNFSGLIATRFFLGIFEATVAPCFITITQMWWRRREQTMRLSLWMAMNGVTMMFGSLIAFGIGHIHGSLRPYQTIFLSPFGAFQIIITLGSAAIATKLKLKWPVLFCLALPPIAGAAALYALGREPELRNKLLGCYYVLSFYTGIQPMLYSWASQNTAGHTKKTCTTGLIYVAQCAGNIVGPLLYKTTDAPYYHRGLISNLICWIILAALTPVTALYLTFLNKRHAAARRRAGKKAEVIDTSLENSKRAREAAKENEKAEGDESGGPKRRLNDQAFNDLTDLQNEDFIYVL
ncbi:hypothetical protein FRC11_008362, partial [Ceratobasidium sp. 423]